MRHPLEQVTLLATIASVIGTAILAISLIAISRDALVEGRGLALVSAAYVAVGLWGFHAPARRTRLPSWVVLAGVVVAGLEFANVWLEEFVGLPPPANAVVPAAMMAVLVLVASTVAVLASAGRAVSHGIIAAVLVVGLGMLLAVFSVLILVALRAAAHPDMMALLRRTCENATMHLTLPLLLAAILGGAAAIAARALRHHARTPVLISLGGIAIFVAGVRLLVLAAALPRAGRPPLVMLGMALSTLGLILVPCMLGRWRRIATA